MVNWKSKYLKMKLKYINAKQKGGANFSNLNMDLRQMIGLNLSTPTYNALFPPKDRIDWCPNQLMKEKYCKKQELALDNNNVECRRCVDDLIDYYKVQYGPQPYSLTNQNKLWTYIGLDAAGPWYGSGPGVFIFNDGSVYEGYFEDASCWDDGLYYTNDGRVIEGILDMENILVYDKISICIGEEWNGRSCPEEFVLFNKKLEINNEDEQLPYDFEKEEREANDFERHPNPTNYEYFKSASKYIEKDLLPSHEKNIKKKHKKNIKKQQQQDISDYTDKQCYYENGVSGTKRKKGPNAASCGSGNNKPGCCISDEPWKTHCNWVVSDGCRKKQSDEFVAQPNQTNLESDEFEEQPNQTNLEFINQEQQQQHITDYTDKQCHYENGVSGTKRKKGPSAASCGDNKPGCCTSDEPWKTHCKWVVRDGCRKK